MISLFLDSIGRVQSSMRDLLFYIRVRRLQPELSRRLVKDLSLVIFNYISLTFISFNQHLFAESIRKCLIMSISTPRHSSLNNYLFISGQRLSFRPRRTSTNSFMLLFMARKASLLFIIDIFSSIGRVNKMFFIIISSA